MRKYIQLGKKIFFFNRSLTGNGTLKTLKIFKKINSLIKIKKFKCGSRVFDWKIPYEWNVKDAYIKDKHQKKIIDFKKNNLHLVNYSTRVNQRINLVNLIKKIHTHYLPEAIPYKTTYYKKNWGFCSTIIQKNNILKKYKKKDLFHVFIDTNFKKNGFMNYGEALIKGRSSKEILISTYICHPSMANNELSGPLLSLALLNYFMKKKLNYSLRFIFVPETIGSIAYIHKNLDKMKKNIIGGYVLSCVGDEKNYSYIKTKYGNSNTDKIFLETVKELKIKIKKYSFLERGSDERQFNSANFPIGTICRTKFGQYKEYHTSLDNFKLVTTKGLRGSFKLVKKVINNFMKFKNTNITLKKKNDNNKILSRILCEPFLEKRKLFPRSGMIKKYKNKTIVDKSKLASKILNFMQFADGTNDLKSISKLIFVPYLKTKKIFRILLKEKLVYLKKINK